MSPQPFLNAMAIARRQNGETTASSVPSAPVIIGIAAGGAVLLCILLTLLGLYIAKVVHRRKKANPQEIETKQDVGKDLMSVLEMRDQDIWPQRHSFTRLPSPQKNSSTNWGTDNSGDTSPTSRTSRIQKRRSLSPQKTLFRISGMRDSWPLVSQMDIPPQHMIQHPSGGHMPLNSSFHAAESAAEESKDTSDQKWPARTYSRASQQALAFEPPDSPEKKRFSRIVEARTHRRKSTSESQLSSILRSTSQRLKRQSLTRARSSIGRFPGSPPKDRLPSPPPEADRPSKGRAKMSTPDPSSYAGSINSSIYETYINRSPSPGRMIARSAGHVPVKREISPTQSHSSSDSLCRTKTPDLVIPALLSSPSKREKRSEQRHRMRISSTTASDASFLIRKDPSSVSTTGDRNSTAVRSKKPPPLNMEADPFYSMRSSSPPVASKGTMLDPRPLNIRKTTFGAEATLERFSNSEPASTLESPLRDVTGNKQSPAKPLMSGALPQTQQNPFQWLPEETLQIKKTTHKSRSSGSKRKGHKRSHTVHMSILPAPQSFGVVPELPEEDSPSTAHLKPKALNMTAPSSPSQGLSVRNSPFRPPSAIDFNPSVNVPSLSDNKIVSSAHLDESTKNATGISSTLLTSNYYSEESNSSEDDFFKQGASSRAKSRRQGYNFSAMAPPADGKLTSFPSPNFTAVDTPELRGSPQLSLTRPSSLIISSPTLSQAVTSQINQVTGPQGPREEVGKKGMTMETQIAMLRRMNSEVSTYSGIGSPCSDGSPTLPDLRGGGISPSKKGSNRASKHYLGIGNGSSPSRRKGRPSIRDSMMRGQVSEKLEKERERRQSKIIGEAIDRRESVVVRKTTETQETIMYDPDDFFSGGQLVPMQPTKKKTTKIHETVIYDPDDFFSGGHLVPMQPSKKEPLKQELSKKESPKGLNIQSLNYPILSPAGQSTVSTAQNLDLNIITRNQTPPRSPELSAEEKRWSDAMIKPQLSGVRSQRQSKMEMPTPRTPPKWASIENCPAPLEKEGRPDSFGLYDHAGFLKSSPERARLASVSIQTS